MGPFVIVCAFRFAGLDELQIFEEKSFITKRCCSSKPFNPISIQTCNIKPIYSTSSMLKLYRFVLSRPPYNATLWKLQSYKITGAKLRNLPPFPMPIAIKRSHSRVWTKHQSKNLGKNLFFHKIRFHCPAN